MTSCLSDVKDTTNNLNMQMSGCIFPTNSWAIEETHLASVHDGVKIAEETFLLKETIWLFHMNLIGCQFMGSFQ